MNSRDSEQTIRLSDYRYQGEVFSLVLTMMIIATIYGLVTFFFPSDWSSTIKTLLITAAGLGVYITSVKLQQRAAFGTMVRVGPRQFPELHELSLKVCQRLSSQPVTVYVKRSSEMNIYTLGLWQKPIIVLTSSLVDQMEPENLQFFIGREVGHIQAGHTWLRTLLKPLGADVPVIGRLFNSVIFGDWINRAEFTADRAGLIACQSLTIAVSTMLKFGVGLKLFEKLDIGAFLEQIHEVRNVRGHLTEIIAEQPYLTQRIRTLIRYALSDRFQELIHEKKSQTQILQSIPEAFLTSKLVRFDILHDEQPEAAGDVEPSTVFDQTGQLQDPTDNSFDPRFTLTAEDGSAIHILRRRSTRLGRNKDNDIVLTSERASRYHAEIVRNGDEVRLVDLESRNGIWVNGARVDRQIALKTGDRLSIGRQAFIFAVKERGK